jgi:hypothetical protein
MTALGGFGKPGAGAISRNTVAELLWGGDNAKGLALFQNAVISGTARDDGNTPTTVLRPGLILGIIASSGEYAEWDPDATDGTQNIAGVLAEELKAQDFDGNDADRVIRVLVRGPVKNTPLLIEGTALDGDTDEYLARRQMALAGFVFDDDPMHQKAGLAPRYATKITDYTVTADENGTTYFATTADAEFTLPALKAGLSYEFIRASDHELVVASAEGDNLVVGNDLSADSVTFTTASEQIGARVRVTGVYLSGTLKWLVELPQAPFGTDAGSAMTIAIAT